MKNIDSASKPDGIHSANRVPQMMFHHFEDPGTFSFPRFGFGMNGAELSDA